MEKVTLRLHKQKNIALIAHDGKKQELIDWCRGHSEALNGHFLCGTGTTARMITEATGLPLTALHGHKVPAGSQSLGGISAGSSP